MVGATGLDLLKSWKYLSVDDIPMFAVGFITSFIVAMLAVVTSFEAFREDRFKTFCILSYFAGYLIYAVHIAIDSYKSHITKLIFKLEYQFFSISPLVLLTSIWHSCNKPPLIIRIFFKQLYPLPYDTIGKLKIPYMDRTCLQTIFIPHILFLNSQHTDTNFKCVQRHTNK